MRRLAAMLDSARADVIADVLSELEERWLLRIETEVRSQQSAELTMAQRSAAESAHIAAKAEKEKGAAERRARWRGILALGTSSTTLVVIAILGSLWKGASSLYTEAREAVQLYNAQSDEVRARSETNTTRIERLEVVVGDPETATLPDGRVVLTEPSLIANSRQTRADMETLIKRIDELVALQKPPPKRPRAK